MKLSQEGTPDVLQMTENVLIRVCMSSGMMNYHE